MKTTFVSIENDPEPFEIWIWYGSVTGGASHVLYDDGSIYLEFKEFYEYYHIFDEEWKQGVGYRIDGDYKTVIVK